MREDLYQQMYNQESYYWWHKGRRELIKKFIPQKQKRQKILDVGCGTGIMMREMKKYGKVYGIDCFPIPLKFCQKRGLKNLFLVDSSKRLPFKNNFFDLIVCLDVLEHIKDDNFALKEFCRILKKKGVLILTVPAYSWFFTYWDKISGHKRRYDKKILEKKLNERGFLIKRISFFNSFSLPIVLIFRPLKKILIGKKKPTSDFITLPGFLNSFLLKISTLERKAVTKFDLPFGLSIICKAIKLT